MRARQTLKEVESLLLTEKLYIIFSSYIVIENSVEVRNNMLVICLAGSVDQPNTSTPIIAVCIAVLSINTLEGEYMTITLGLSVPPHTSGRTSDLSLFAYLTR